VIEYAQPLREIAEPGFTFMNGPGNDLEGIAGQVAAGCNLIIFVTGNGSVTNFPFIPTLKITTTTRRHELLINEMDINAGRYLDGEPMGKLVAESFSLTIATASGRKTKGEHAGHSQVSLWRNWPQTNDSHLAELGRRVLPDGVPLRHATGVTSAGGTAPLLEVFCTETGFATERVALVLPNSLCSSQISRLAANRMNEKQIGRAHGISRFVALAHTEACGSSGAALFRTLARTYRGYITHPNVAAALLLEHGCEKITNDVMRHELESAGLPIDRFGWASVQLDGGIAKSLDKIEAWFTNKLASLTPATRVPGNLGSLNVGMMTDAQVSDVTAMALASVTNTIVNLGGSLLIPETDAILANPAFLTAVLGSPPSRATLAYGQPISQPGLHIVASETDHWVENLTGMGGCGAHLVLAVVSKHSRQGHPLLPVIQVAESSQRKMIAVEDNDLILAGDANEDEHAIEELIAAVARAERMPVANAQGFVDFQFTRGLLGVTS
jgi:altronate dehydratase